MRFLRMFPLGISIIYLSTMHDSPMKMYQNLTEVHNCSQILSRWVEHVAFYQQVPPQRDQEGAVCSLSLLFFQLSVSFSVFPALERMCHCARLLLLLTTKGEMGNVLSERKSTCFWSFEKYAAFSSRNEPLKMCTWSFLLKPDSTFRDELKLRLQLWIW